MEKLLRRSILNRNQLVAKRRRESAKDLRKSWRDYNRGKNMQDNELNRIMKEERQARREDWVLGPLAPARDIGMQKETFGAISNLLAQGPQLPGRELRWPKGNGYDAKGREDQRIPGFEDGEWKGEGLRGNLVVGDRVVVVKGRNGVKGKIGEVVRIDRKADQVFVKGINKVDMQVPPQALVSANGAKIFEQELPLPISDILLVTQLQDSHTGALKDVIVRSIYGGAPYQQRNPGSNHPRHTRYVRSAPGSDSDDIPVAWPKEDPDRFYTQGCDTTRNDVESISYFPTFRDEVGNARVPVWGSAVDELRSKHSRQRRDMDDLGLMRRKLLEDARRDWFAGRSRVLSEPFWTKGFLVREKKGMEERRRRTVVGEEQTMSA